MSRPFEVALAQRLHVKRGLTPPVDIFTLARQYAEVDVVDIPVDVDGLCFDLKIRGQRPKILLSNKPERRMRFTAAHELGHVLIPWHLGTRIDDFSGRVPASIADEEAEANRFASELMLSSEWVRARLEGVEDVAAAVAALADEARMSLIATSLKAISVLPAGYSFVCTDPAGIVEFSDVSPRTFAERVGRGLLFEDEPYPEMLARWERHQLGPHGEVRFIWWRLPQELGLPAVQDERDWRNILEEIIGNLCLPPGEAAYLWGSVSAVIAAANGSLGPAASKEALHASARERIRQRATREPPYARLCSHPKFSDFLVRRIEALRGRPAAHAPRGRTPSRQADR